jgi:hypothetical protein
MEKRIAQRCCCDVPLEVIHSRSDCYEQRPVRMINFSPLGVGFESDVPFAVGARLVLRLKKDIPQALSSKCGELPEEALAQVKWCHQVDQPLQPYRTGTQYLY